MTPKADDERRAEAEVEAVAYPIFVGVAKAPWTRRDDDELCPVEPFSKNHARNLARAAIKELDRVRDARGDDEGHVALNQTRCSGCTEAVRDEEPLRFRSGVLWHEACLAARSPQAEDHGPVIVVNGEEVGRGEAGMLNALDRMVPPRSPQDEVRDARGDEYPCNGITCQWCERGHQWEKDGDRYFHRVRDARGDDEACPACGHEWRRHDPEDGRCDAHSAEPGIFGPCRCGRDVAFTAAANARLSRGALAARSPQGEGHEAGIEAGDRFEQVMPYGHDTVEVEGRIDDERVAVVRTSGARQAFPISTLLNEWYWRRVSSSRVGSVAVEDVVEALRRYADDPERVRAIGGEVGRISVRLADWLLAEFSRSSSGRPEQPEPDALGGQPPAEPGKPGNG
jgi:hypothetical protein